MPMERGLHAKTPSNRPGFREFCYVFGRYLPYAHTSFTIPELEDGFDFKDFARTVCIIRTCTCPVDLSNAISKATRGPVTGENFKIRTPPDRPLSNVSFG